LLKTDDRAGRLTRFGDGGIDEVTLGSEENPDLIR